MDGSITLSLLIVKKIITAPGRAIPVAAAGPSIPPQPRGSSRWSGPRSASMAAADLIGDRRRVLDKVRLWAKVACRSRDAFRFWLDTALPAAACSVAEFRGNWLLLRTRCLATSADISAGPPVGEIGS